MHRSDSQRLPGGDTVSITATIREAQQMLYTRGMFARRLLMGRRAYEQFREELGIKGLEVKTYHHMAVQVSDECPPDQVFICQKVCTE